MSSSHVAFRPATASGQGLFSIKLENKHSHFEFRAKPALDIEELNSGMYILRRLAVALQNENLRATSLVARDASAIKPKFLSEQPALSPTAHSQTQTSSSEPTKDNVETVNGQTMAATILDGLAKAGQESPELSQDPEIAAAVATLTPLLKKEKLTEDDLTTIYDYSAKIGNELLSQYLSPSSVATYKQSIVAAYETIMNNITVVRQQIDNEKTTLENKITAAEQVIVTFTSWLEGASRLKEKYKYSSELVTQSMEFYANLNYLSQMKQASAAPDEILNMVEPLISKYLDLYVVPSNARVTQFIARSCVYQELADYTLHHIVSKEGGEEALRAWLKQRGEDIKKLPFLDKIGDAVSHIANENPIKDQYVRLNDYKTSTTSQSSYYVPDFNKFYNEILLGSNPTQATIDENFVPQAQAILKEFEAKAGAYIQAQQLEVAKLTARYDELAPNQAPFTLDRHDAVQSWLEATNLGSALIFLVLNSEIPKQKVFLDPLVQEINFNNLAAKSINDLLAITNDFSTTSVYYNLSSYLVQSKNGVNKFAGDYFEVLSAISREREYIARDLERCTRAQTLVNQLLATIEAMTDVSSSQKTAMLNATKVYNLILSSTFNQLNVLDSLLVNLKIEATKSGDQYSPNIYTISGPMNEKDWIPVLASLEGFVSSGFPSASPAGGLGPLFTQVQSDQQNYLSQSQTQQLNLQNQMTNIQQEWTLLTTSMQVLNTTLTQLAGEIYSS